MKFYQLVFLLVTSVFISCQDEEPNIGPIQMEVPQLPIVMLHGTLASGDTYALQFQRFISNGYAADELYAFDWNSIDEQPIELLDSFIETVLVNTGAEQINLLGHSAGGGFAFNYLNDIQRAGKVNKYAHIAGTSISGPAGPTEEIPTLNLYSPDDRTVAGSDILNVTNVSIDGKDHYEIATSEESFEALYSFFNEKQPEFLTIQEDEMIHISGRVVTLGENESLSNIDIEIYALDNTNGERLSLEPTMVLESNTKGNWGPIEVEKNRNYEFVISDENNPDFRKLHYYREGFVKSDGLVYLRAFPPMGSLAGLLLSAVPRDDNQSVLAIFSANKAMINGRDELLVDDQVLSTVELTSADQTTIALFVYDDGDEESSLSPHASFSFSPFLNGADQYISTEEEKYITVKFNNRTLHVRNWKSETEGVSVLVFN